MSKTIYSRSQLTAQQTIRVERAQFAPIGPKHQDWYDGQRKYLEALIAAEQAVEQNASVADFLALRSPKTKPPTKPLDELAIYKNGVQLTNRELSTIVNATSKRNMRTTNQPGVGNEYVSMICQYVNKVRDPGRHMDIPSCCMLTSSQFDKIKASRRPPDTSEAHARKALKQLGFKDMQTFRKLDFLFVPYIQYGAHSLLVGIAPKQRFVFVIDSGPTRYTLSDSLVRGLNSLLLTLSPDIQYAKDNKRPQQGEWRLYGQWSHRSKTTDDSPDGPQQNDEYNCGVFTATSAFCLAAGFNLGCFAEGDLDKSKKPRMAAEFANGGLFGPGFDYDLLELPLIGQQPPPSPRMQTRQHVDHGRQRQGSGSGTQRRTDVPQRKAVGSGTQRHDPGVPQRKAVGSGSGRRQTDHGPQRPTSSSGRPTSSGSGGVSKREPPQNRERKESILKRIFSSKKKDRKDDDDDQLQRGFGEDDDDSGFFGDADDDSDISGSDGESDDEDSLPFKKEPLYTSKQLAEYLSLSPKTSTSALKNAVEYPAQFSPHLHQQTTLIHDIPAFFNLQNRKYSKRELKKACRDFQVVDWKQWSFERQGFFMKWVMSEIGGILARRRGDEILPFPGVGEVPELIPETVPIRIQPSRSVKKKRGHEVVKAGRVGKRRG